MRLTICCDPVVHRFSFFLLARSGFGNESFVTRDVNAHVYFQVMITLVLEFLHIMHDPAELLREPAKLILRLDDPYEPNMASDCAEVVVVVPSRPRIDFSL